MRDFFFELPWWMPLGIVILAAVAFVSATRTQNRAPVRIAIGLVALAVVLLLVSMFFQSPREQVRQRSAEIVHAVRDNDWSALRQRLDPHTSFAFYENASQITEAAQTAAERYGLKNIRLMGMSAEQTGTIIAVTLNAYSEQEITLGRPLLSQWQLNWYLAEDGWYLNDIVLVKIGDQPFEQVSGRLPSVQSQRP